MNLHKHKKGEISLVKVKVKNLTKIFGKKTQVALEIDQKSSTEAVYIEKNRRNGQYYDVALMFKKAKYSLSWVLR